MVSRIVEKLTLLPFAYFFFLILLILYNPLLYNDSYINLESYWFQLKIN